MSRLDALRQVARAAHPRSSLGLAARVELGVENTAELQRVLALPRRQWEGEVETEELTALLSKHLRVECGEQTLRASQVVALRDLFEERGLLAIMAVGEGKTLVTLLAPTLLEVKHPLLLVPAALRDKTARDRAAYAKHWDVGDPVVWSYEELGRADRDGWLDELKPDLIMADEAHRLKSRDAAVTRRVERYMKAQPETIFSALSGTLTKRSILDWWHLAWWALRNGAPIPAKETEARAWASALDVGVDFGSRLALGALGCFGDTVASARDGFGRWARFTPGIVAPKPVEVGASLRLTRISPPIPAEVSEAISHVENTGTDMGGEELLPEDVVGVVKQLALGFYYKWDPQAPEPWMKARRLWYRVVREILDQHMDGLDSPFQIASAVAAGRFGDVPEWKTWADVRDTFEPNPVPVWLTKEILVFFAELEPYKSAGSLIWCTHRAVGHAFQEIGVDYYGEGGLCARTEESITQRAAQAKPGTIALSISANSEGRNLQAWSRSLVLCPPSSGATWEQLIGRTHRPGQNADEVEIGVAAHVSAYDRALARARSEANYLQQVTGQPQKLLLADQV